MLAERARQDPAFARALETWRHRAEAWDQARTGAGDVHNEISGGTFQGPVVQARDINGPLTFGGQRSTRWSCERAKRAQRP